MKTEQVFEITIAKLKGQENITAQEMMYKHKIPAVQFYSCVNSLIKLSAVKLNEYEGKKSWTLVDAGKLPVAEKVTPKKESGEKKQSAIVKEEIKPLKNSQQKGRDLSKYKFNGAEYNKGRLALAIIFEYAKTKKPTLKQALTIFPAEIVPPYGTIAEVKEARKMSKARPRFFLKDEELVRLKDCVIAVSNQWTVDRVNRIIAIAKKDLKFSIK